MRCQFNDQSATKAVVCFGEFSPLGDKQKSPVYCWTHAKDFCEKYAPKSPDFVETNSEIAIFRQ
jgi:hypothetical protein